MKVAVSSCLLGKPCRFDATSRPCEAVCALKQVPGVQLVPVCPEVLGGLTPPHPPSEIVAAERALRVVSQDGADMTDAFVAGAQATLDVVQREGCKLAILKAKSPSCGNGAIYDGTFSGTLVEGYGVAARLLRAQSVRVVDEVQYAEASAASEQRHPGSLPALLADTSAACPPLETERLVLRALTAGDVDDVFAYCSDPNVGPDAGWAVHRTLDDARIFVEEIANAPHVFGLFEKRDAGTLGPCIGSVGLIPDPQRRNVDALMLGYSLAKPAWGRGYMTEAAREVIRYGFDELALKLITCSHYTFNARSKRVIEKCGFTYEGLIHAVEATPDGIMQDFALYYLTRDAWQARG